MKINCSCSVIPLLKYFSHMFFKQTLSATWTPSNHGKDLHVNFIYRTAIIRWCQPVTMTTTCDVT
jgi:hypothetical protein